MVVKMDKLKPCPFCGEKAELIMKTQGYTLNPIILKNSFVVGCESCQIFTKAYESRIYQEDDGSVVVEKNGAEDAAKQWNRRANYER